MTVPFRRNDADHVHHADVAVTICIPSYNRADLVSETLDSLLAQTDQGTGTLWRRDSFIRLGRWDEQLPIWQTSSCTSGLPRVNIALQSDSICRPTLTSGRTVRVRADVHTIRGESRRSRARGKACSRSVATVR